GVLAGTGSGRLRDRGDPRAARAAARRRGPGDVRGRSALPELPHVPRPPVRRVAVIASASGNGKTTVGRKLAERLGVPFVEMDALVHGPGWTEISDEGLREIVEPIVAGEGWVIDAVYERKIGHLVLDSADT